MTHPQTAAILTSWSIIRPGVDRRADWSTPGRSEPPRPGERNEMCARKKRNRRRPFWCEWAPLAMRGILIVVEWLVNAHGSK